MDLRKTYTYDEDNKLLTLERDGSGHCLDTGQGDADGILNVRIIYTYDENGNISIEEADGGADGSVDSSYTFTYDCE